MLTPNSTLQNGRYLIVRRVGRGGMGAVYEAVETSINKRVALKESLVEEPHLRHAFEREAKRLAQLDHPALPDVSHHFTEGDGQYLVMKFIDGQDLAEALAARRAPFPVEQVLKWAEDLLEVLAYLHRQTPPVIHRDIKPANIKVLPNGQAVLLDFGLAKGGMTQLSQVSHAATSVYGYTLDYASPEQIAAQRTDARSDLFSLAATLYALLTNRPPADARLREHAAAHDLPDPLRPAASLNPAVPTALSEALMQAMALSPSARFTDAGAMWAALRRNESDRMEARTPVKASPPRVTSTSRRVVIPQRSERRNRPNTIPVAPVLIEQTTGSPKAVEPSSARVFHKDDWGGIGLVILLFSLGLLVRTAPRATTSDNMLSPESVQQSMQGTTTSIEQPITGTAIPTGVSSITDRNVDEVEQLEQWEQSLQVSAVAWSPDGGTLAADSQSKRVRLWRATDGVELRNLGGHGSWVTDVAWSLDGNMLASSSNDSRLRLWRVSDGALVQTLEGHIGGVLSVAWSSDSSMVASASWDKTVRVWRASDGILLHTLEGHTTRVTGVAWSPDSSILASAADDKTVRLWRSSDGALLRTLVTANAVRSVAWSPDGSTLASALDDHSVILSRSSDGSLLRTLRGHMDDVSSVVWSPDGSMVASASWDNTLRLWRASDGALLRTLEGHIKRVTSVAWSPDGSTLASASADGTVRLWGVSR